MTTTCDDRTMQALLAFQRWTLECIWRHRSGLDDPPPLDPFMFCKIVSSERLERAFATLPKQWANRDGLEEEVEYALHELELIQFALKSKSNGKFIPQHFLIGIIPVDSVALMRATPGRRWKTSRYMAAVSHANTAASVVSLDEHRRQRLLAGGHAA
jgi:hypothetical protein